MTRTLTIPIRSTGEISLQLPGYPLTEQEWAVFQNVLEAMRPQLVEQLVDDDEIRNAQIVDDDATEIAVQAAHDLGLVVLRGNDPPVYWHGSTDEWREHVERLAREYTDGEAIAAKGNA